MTILKFPLPGTKIINDNPNEVLLSDRQNSTMLCKDFDKIINSMLALLNEEMSLINDNKLYEASKLSERKLWLATSYENGLKIFKNNAENLKKFVPLELEGLKHRHTILSKELKKSMNLLSRVTEIYTSIMKQASRAIELAESDLYDDRAKTNKPHQSKAGLFYNHHY